jgi:RecA-family ATPase
MNIQAGDLGDFHVVTKAAEENAFLGGPDAKRDDAMRMTRTWDKLVKLIKRLKPRLVIIDPLADVYSGTENVRVATPLFIRKLRKVAIENHCPIILAVHPSLTGIKDGTGVSGSTGWVNSARGCMFLAEEMDDDEDPVHGMRTLVVNKLNNGREDDGVI